jgi:hypothetical protein
MTKRLHTARDPLLVAILILAFVFTLMIRVWGISARFWLHGDQIRDWSIALGPLADLPLVGPPTHVQGYTVGPAFYWILWAIRVVVGPWFQNLPHAGGIGQAALESASDTLLLVAVWRRTGSVWIALATIVLLATAPFALSLSAVVWNPVVGATLAKTATALVLLDWHRGSAARVALTAAVAWSAVHAYTGAIFVAVSVFTGLLVDPFARGDRRGALRNALMIAIAVILLQVPYMAHQVANRFGDSAMGAVTDSVGRIFSGRDRPRFAESATGYVAAFNFIEVEPWHVPWSAWVLVACGAILAVRYRRDPMVLTTTLLPQIAAIAGYAFFLAGLDHYYYLSLMPAAVLTLVLGATALPSYALSRAIGMALLVGALAIVPARLRLTATMFRMPEYGVLVRGSRTIVERGQPIRAIETEFSLPPTSSPEFLYRVLGGRIDPRSPWVGVITSTAHIEYRNVGGS